MLRTLVKTASDGGDVARMYTYLERLKSTDGGLREDVAVEGAEREADVGLREAELDSSLFELASERFQVVRRRRLHHLVLLQTAAAITVSGCRAAVGTRRRVGHLAHIIVYRHVYAEYDRGSKA